MLQSIIHGPITLANCNFNNLSKAIKDWDQVFACAILLINNYIGAIITYSQLTFEQLDSQDSEDKQEEHDDKQYVDKSRNGFQ